MTTYNASKKRGGLDRITARKGWLFIMPAVILIVVMSFYPMIQAFTLSLQTGTGSNLKFGGLANYQRLPKDNTYTTALGNTFYYLIIQVPIMLILALILASLLNDKRLMGRGIYRTLIFLPCATSLVSCSMILPLRSMRYRSGVPPLLKVTTMVRPSGEKAGARFNPLRRDRALVVLFCRRSVM